MVVVLNCLVSAQESSSGHLVQHECLTFSRQYSYHLVNVLTSLAQLFIIMPFNLGFTIWVIVIHQVIHYVLHFLLTCTSLYHQTSNMQADSKPHKMLHVLDFYLSIVKHVQYHFSMYASEMCWDMHLIVMLESYRMLQIIIKLLGFSSFLDSTQGVLSGINQHALHFSPIVCLEIGLAP